jgi:folate-dependent phosphoribosylglycinamide formyltransferase PurN
MEENAEKIVDANILHDVAGRKIINDVGDPGWGQLIIPAPQETSNKSEGGLRVVVFGSYLLGYKVLETLKKCEQANQGRINICGLVTDDPASPHAKISVKRRIWRLYDDSETVRLETAMIESGLTDGIPVYTGKVKTEYFHQLLDSWKPDVILVCVFGQIIDDYIINLPPHGIYNFHPSDLLSKHGAGPQPYQDLINRDATTSKLTIHELTAQLDGGHVVGQSSDVNVRFEDGSITDNILVIDDKMIQPADLMATLLIRALVLHKEEGLKGRIHTINFAKHFNPEYKKMLMEPIQSRIHSDKLPIPSDKLDFLIPG